MKYKKIFAVAAGLTLIGAAMSGCTSTINLDGQKVTAEEVTSMINDAKIESMKLGVESVDITQDNAGVIAEAVTPLKEQVERDAQIIADYKAELKSIEDEKLVELELSEKEAKGYLLDDVSLTENFATTIDSDDLEVLKLYEVEYDDEDYDVEEKLYLTSDVAPKLNLKDLNGEVVIEIADEGAIEYAVEFDSEIDVNKDEELEIMFLGKPMKIVSFTSEDTIEYRMSELFTGAVGTEFVYNNQIVKIVSINEDGEKVLVSVDDEMAIIEEGSDEKVSGLKIAIKEAIKGSSTSYVELYIGEEITEEVEDGDDYEADDRFEWSIKGNAEGLLSVGLKYVEEKTDDDEVLKVGDSIAFPNDYVQLRFDSVKNIELEDVTLKVTDDEVRLSFDGKIEVDGERVDDGKLTFYMNDGVATYDYEHNGDKVENLTEMSDIVLFQDDRELSVEFTDSTIEISDPAINYKFSYDFETETFTEAHEDAENVDDDDNYRIDNGDLLYKVDFEDDDVDEIKIGLVNDEGAEVLLKVE